MICPFCVRHGEFELGKHYHYCSITRAGWYMRATLSSFYIFENDIVFRYNFHKDNTVPSFRDIKIIDIEANNINEAYDRYLKYKMLM